MAQTGTRPRHKVLWFALGASGLVLVGVAAGFIVLLSGGISTAATTQHFRITYAILDAGLRFSVRTHANDIVVPALDRAGMFYQGLSCFRTHCAQCHGAPAISPAAQAKGLLPIPSSLAQSGREWPAAWLYYVTKKGVRMAGMPAWEYRIADEGLWSTVAFLQRLPFMTADEYRVAAQDASSVACPPSSESPPVYSADHAKEVLRQYACDSCHRIEGVVGPNSYAGPPLTRWGKRKFIAGVLPNTRDNLVRWLMDPQAVSPQTLMPDLNVSEAHAREMTMYLMELE